MSLDEQIHPAFDRAFARLREHVHADLTAFAHEVMTAHAEDMRAASDAAGTSRLLDGMRALDAATSLSEALDALAQAAAGEVARSAVLVVDGAGLKGWRLSGFGDAALSPRSIAIAGSDAGLAAAPAQTFDAMSSRRSEEQMLPLFARGAGPRDALAFPIPVDRQVVAVLYADNPLDEKSGHWRAVLEALARHTGRVLESLTVQQAKGLSFGSGR